MIEAIIPKNIEAPKAQTASKEVSNLETALEGNEFSAELEASLNTGATNVKPVEVTADEVLSLPSNTVDATSPKVFDPELTRGVEKLVGPETTEVKAPLSDAEVLELANAKVELKNEVKAEAAQNILKNVQGDMKGRAPAVDLAKSEIDPQLLNNEDFVAQKNLLSKKIINQNAYGMKAAPVQQQKLAMENGLQTTQVVKETADASSTAMNSQQFILGLQAGTPALQTNEAEGAVKVFDMSQIKSTNPTEIMNQITDYAIQAKAAKEPTVNMRVNHSDLGMIDITVVKAGTDNDTIAVSIGAHTLDGKSFFQQNSRELFTHLSNAGLTVSDLKVETPTQTAKNDFDFGSQSGRNQHGADKQFGSEQNQRRHEQERRQDLWKLFNQEAA